MQRKVISVAEPELHFLDQSRSSTEGVSPALFVEDLNEFVNLFRYFGVKTVFFMRNCLKSAGRVSLQHFPPHVARYESSLCKYASLMCQSEHLEPPNSDQSNSW